MKTIKQLKGAIKRIATSGKKLDAMIHETSIDCLKHAQEHGDVTLLADLCSAMPKGSRVQGLMLWLTDHAPITLTYSTKLNGYVAKLKKKREDSDWKIEQANATPFWDYSKENTPILLTAESFEKRIHAMIASANKKIAEGLIEEADKSKLEGLVEKLTQTTQPTITH